MARFKPIPTEAILWAYSHGIFPMADSRQGEIEWYSADPRAILPLENFHASHSLRQRLRRSTYEIRTDTAFAQVIEMCSQPRPGHPVTWINDQIIEAFTRLHKMGLTHSVEAWTRPRNAGEPSELVGGLYGLALGGAFFGESMFSRATDASKVCLCHLVEHLRRKGFALLDVQMTSDHMAQFGTILVSREEYLERLSAAIELEVTW